MEVDRCICADKRFVVLKEIADRERLGFEELCHRTGCCRGCGLCEPYVARMLETGRTSFPVAPVGNAPA